MFEYFYEFVEWVVDLVVEVYLFFVLFWYLVVGYYVVCSLFFF